MASRNVVPERYAFGGGIHAPSLDRLPVTPTRQITRQLDLLRTLCAQRPYGLTVTELAGRLDRTVSRRTLERDLHDLCEAGFPLYPERRGRHVYWNLTPDAKLPPLNITVLEIAALIFAEGMSDALAGTPFREDLRAVCRRLQTTLTPGMQAYFTRAVEVYSPYPRRQKSYAGFQDLIDRLNQAILERRVCQVTYLAMGVDQPKTYPIEPLRLFHYHGGLYLVSRAPAYDQLITQAVERIKDIQRTSRTFEPPDDCPSRTGCATPSASCTRTPLSAESSSLRTRPRTSGSGSGIPLSGSRSWRTAVWSCTCTPGACTSSSPGS